MVKIFGYNLFGCSVCNGTKKRHFKNKSTRKRRTFKGGYVYKEGDKSLSNSSEVIPASKSPSNSNGKGRGKGRGKGKR
jgi:hypothetical protein